MPNGYETHTDDRMVGPWNLKVDQVEDMDVFEFLLQGKDFDSIHPSLQRQTILNMNYGLYEVLPNKTIRAAVTIWPTSQW